MSEINWVYPVEGPLTAEDLECDCHEWSPDPNMCTEDCLRSEDPYEGCMYCDLRMAIEAEVVRSCECGTNMVYYEGEECYLCTRFYPETGEQWYDQEGQTCYIRALTNALAQRKGLEQAADYAEMQDLYEEIRTEFVQATERYAPEGLYSYTGSNFLKAMRIVKHVYRKYGMVRQRVRTTIQEIATSYECAILELRVGESGSSNHYSVVVREYYDTQEPAIVDAGNYTSAGRCEDDGESFCYGCTEIRDVWVFKSDAKN